MLTAQDMYLALFLGSFHSGLVVATIPSNYTSIVSVEVNVVFLLNSPGKVSTPMAATPSAPVEISDNFNTRYLLGRACRDVLQHGQVCCWHHAQTLYCVVSLLELYTQLCLQAVFLLVLRLCARMV